MTKISVKFCQNLKRANGNVKQIVCKAPNFNLISILYNTILYENEKQSSRCNITDQEGIM